MFYNHVARSFFVCILVRKHDPEFKFDGVYVQLKHG